MGLNSSINRFFREFETTTKGAAFAGFMVVILFLILLGIYSNFRTDADISFACIIYSFMLIFIAIVGAIDQIKNSVKFLGSLFPSGKWKYLGLVPFIIGGIFGYFMVTQNQTIGLSFLQLSGTNAFFFIVIAAPIVEEWFFRGTLFPTVCETLKNFANTRYYSILALIIANAAFSLFHYYVYGANINAVYVATFLGVIYTIGNYATKSVMFSTSAHMMNNYLLWVMAGGMLG